MRSWLFWLALIGAGLVCGAVGAGGVMRVAGVNVTKRAPGQATATPVIATLASDAAPTPAADPPAAPSPMSSASDAPRSLFPDTQIVSYYGHPLAASMGVLGEGPRTAMIERLRLQAAAYQALAPDKAVVPALHLIYEVAQASTNADGLYLYRTEDETVRQFIQLTRDEHMLLFLDLQIGRSTLKDELAHVMPYLKEPHVHLAIDPEFVTLPGYRPGQFIGTLDCLQVNAAEETIARLVEAERLPNKIVLVHQFNEDMLTHKEKLRFDLPGVDTVLDMDGYGDQAGKLGEYQRLIKDFGAKYAGIKLFYKQDRGLLSEEQIEGLDPRPNVIIYQ